ncbi:hypothetical protein LC593_14425 [Nostoc sp. CHAB 5844]|nr:hypothetical protein [Nostoc sp. CHAB 5844]
MDYLTQAHQELVQSQESDLIINFDAAFFQLKVAAIGVSLIVGVSSAAIAWKGQMSDRVYFCLKTPTQEWICEDGNHRPYRMTTWQWQQWEKQGRPKTVVMNHILKADNPYKSFWAGGAFLGFTIAGRLLKHLKRSP